METKDVFFNLKSSYMSSLALCDSFQYLCYGFTTIIHMFTLTVRASTLDVRILRLKSMPACKGLEGDCWTNLQPRSIILYAQSQLWASQSQSSITTYDSFQWTWVVWEGPVAIYIWFLYDFCSVTMVTVFSNRCKLNFAEDLTGMCVHRDVNYHKLIVLLTCFFLGICLTCNTNV